MAKFLLPTDLSSNALNASRYAIQLFGVEGNEFIVLHTYMTPRGAASTMWNMEDMLAVEAQEGLDAFIAAMKEDPLMANAKLTGIIEHGDLPSVLTHFATDPAPPLLVVMGTQGASGLKEVLLGSNTADVIKGSALAVLAVPQNAIYAMPERLMLADDGGPLEKADLSVLLDIARRTRAEVMVVRVSDPEHPGTETGVSFYDEKLGDMPHSYHFISGAKVNDALHEMAERVNANMVVLLHRKRSMFEGLFHKSITTKLAMHTHIPMLVLQDHNS